MSQNRLAARAWLFATVLLGAVSAVHHAGRLAVRLGESFGTLVLTLLLSSITFANGVNNILQGAIHLMLFFGFLMLLVWP